MTYAWRPCVSCSRTSAYTSSRRESGLTSVRTGCRPGGSPRMTDTSMSPHSVSASVRGIGVAVITSTSGCRPFAPSVAALQHAEAMLLVDDDQGQRAELDVLLHQRVRADDQVDVAALDRRQQRRGARPRSIRPLSSATRKRVCASQREIVADVLLGQDLGRRHERDLIAVLHGHHRGQQRDDRLAGADIALQQPLHRPCLLHVGDDLGQRLTLTVGQLERQHGARRGADAVVDRRDEALADLRVLLAPQRETRLEDEEVFEDQPALRRRRETRLSASTGVPASGKCACSKRVAPRRPALARADLARHRIEQIRRGVARAPARRSAAACSW